ncbi:hypothetical protein QBC41DRAFT_283273 [Cercophora samala]|uniref:FAD-dependent oxidoreductase 2 FAD-binding domain-containing protein n=1 Tax=Cercophora samala TaxID=330535 RepID=A0AA39Z854_9PEZI|nr:hypothetical protein QBC41DRAFT_283273 [Cercophora samala]
MTEETPLSIIIVGAGFAGLTAAIECHRKGFTNLLLLEKSPSLAPLGDIISFGQNSSRIFNNWGNLRDQLDPIIHKAEEVHFHDASGRYVTTQSFKEEHRAWGPRINGHRGEIHSLVYHHALSLGIPIRLGISVTKYFETPSHAGVETSSGETFTADLVLAAEGVRSKARTLILGSEDLLTLPSGYAVFRSWFPTPPSLYTSPLTSHLVSKGDTHHAWIGTDVHFLAASIKSGREISWVCTHVDASDIAESWQLPGSKAAALAVLEGWDPAVRELVGATPEGRLVDYKLVFRDPLPTFVSPEGRTLLVGDAAHPFLPTSIQGASQAMEDGVVLAVCLDRIKGDRSRLREAVGVWEGLRYERVHRIQRTGVTTREQWHKADWDVIWKEPEVLHLKREGWILDFDSEKDAEERYDSVKEGLVKEGKL